MQLHQEKNTMQEKQAMIQMDHPFVLKLHGTFQDANCLYVHNADP